MPAQSQTQHFRHDVLAFIDPGDEFGLVYTVGLYPQANELAAIEVPRADIEDVAALMNFLSGRALKDMQTAQSSKGHVYILRALPDELEEGLKSTTCPLMDAHAGVLVLHRLK